MARTDAYNLINVLIKNALAGRSSQAYSVDGWFRLYYNNARKQPGFRLGEGAAMPEGRGRISLGAPLF
jgi:hypothetical protein